MSEIKDLEPKLIWRNFDALTQVPHPSGTLQQMQQFLLNWARQQGIEAFKDNAENIVMRKPATQGMENRKTAVLQAHMDMVPQQINGGTHNFETDSIQTYIDGEWVKAKSTTLGADNGVGVAAIMAVMEDKTLVHGPLEALITSDEESCMYGVNHLAADTLTGDILLNMDNETMGEFVIGSAGGVNVTATLGYKEVEPEAGDIAIKVTLKGLRGGHSGLEINQGRANANKLMARFVHAAIADDEARLVSWHGGNMRNAIPRECEVVLTIPEENEADLQDLVAYCKTLFIEEYRGVELADKIEFYAERADMPTGEVPLEIQDNLVSAILACQDGVFRNIPSIPEIVETSSNLAIINIGGGESEILILARSSSDSMMEYVTTSLERCFAIVGMKVEYSGQYGAWQPNFDSVITSKMVQIYKEIFQEEAQVQVCHAGLECSMIGAIYPKMDLVSFGPTIRSPHTPDERCHIPSVAQFWIFLKELLAQMPEK